MRFLSLAIVLLVSHFAPAAPDPTPTAAPSIVRVPWAGAPKRIDPSVKLTGSEFELLTIQGAGGSPVTWDCSSPNSFGSPIKLIELKPKESVVGLRVGTTEPDRYESPDTPSVAVFAVNSGNVTLSCWGVKDSKPVKLATFQIAANLGPQPPPNPPDPPVPPVVPVVDPLAAPVQAAFAAEHASVTLPDGTVRSKALDVVGLAAAYRSTAKAVATFKTIGDFAADLKTTRTAAVGERIPGVRAVLAAELAKTLPNTVNTPLTDVQKTAAAGLLNRFAGLLDGVK